MFSAPELVENGKTGFVLKHPFKQHDDKFQLKYNSFEEYASKLKILLKDEKLRKKIGEAGRKEIVKGKFSIKERDKKLIKIYMDAIKQKN